MNPKLALEELRIEIASAAISLPREWWIGDRNPRHGYVLFGSTVLWLHGLRDDDTVGDVDVFVERSLWAQLAGRDGWEMQRPHPTDPPFLERHVDGAPKTHAFYDWTPRDRWISVQRCFDLAEEINGWRCTPLREILEHKREAWAHTGHDPHAAQAKHARDIRVLEQHLGRPA